MHAWTPPRSPTGSCVCTPCAPGPGTRVLLAWAHASSHDGACVGGGGGGQRRIRPGGNREGTSVGSFGGNSPCQGPPPFGAQRSVSRSRGADFAVVDPAPCPALRRGSHGVCVAGPLPRSNPQFVRPTARHRRDQWTTTHFARQYPYVLCTVWQGTPWNGPPSAVPEGPLAGELLRRGRGGPSLLGCSRPHGRAGIRPQTAPTAPAGGGGDHHLPTANALSAS